ncbi:MAG: class I SAM-dependent methyltransferase, partial [Bacteroidota bacterium]
MTIAQQRQIAHTIAALYHDAKNDHFKMMKGVAKSMFRPIHPNDFKNVYLSISHQQGEDLTQLIQRNNFKNIVEFGTSFGISTLFLAQGAMETGGHIITTELIESKALRAIENFKRAGVRQLIEVRIGDALQTLRPHSSPIDLLLLDGWKDLYLPLFQMLEPNFHSHTVIYVDNADMSETQAFLRRVSENGRYHLQSYYRGKVV